VSAGCLFCDIAAGVRDAHVVYEEALTLAFLDVRPVFPGHTLLIPRDHHETLVDLPAALHTPLLGGAQLLARAMEGDFGADGSFVAVNNRVSQSVAHLHVHVVPRHRKDGLRGFFWPRQKYAGDAEMASVAQRLRDAVARAEADSRSDGAGSDGAGLDGAGLAQAHESQPSTDPHQL
jgi:histidine triad (HIT) family protein